MHTTNVTDANSTMTGLKKVQSNDNMHSNSTSAFIARRKSAQSNNHYDMPLKKDEIIDIQLDNKQTSQHDENEKYEWHSAQEPNKQEEEQRIKSSGHVSQVSMFDKEIYEQELLDEAPITPRALMTDMTNNNNDEGAIMTSSNGKQFKTSRGPTAINEKLSTERLSSSFYVDDPEDGDKDEGTDHYDEEKNIETYDGSGLNLDLNQTVIQQNNHQTNNTAEF